MDKKKIKRFFNLTLSACVARFEDSGVGPILSPFMNKEKVTNFCNDFNNFSKKYKSGLPLRVYLCLFSDNSFFFYVKGVSFSLLLKLILNLERFNSCQELDLFDFFLLLFLNNNLIADKNKIYNKIYFFSLINFLNSTKNLIVKNEFFE